MKIRILSSIALGAVIAAAAVCCVGKTHAAAGGGNTDARPDAGDTAGPNRRSRL